MKRLHILPLLAALTLLLCCLLPTKAEAATSGYYTYSVSGGKATITDCSTSISGNVTIPSTLGGYPVTSIGDSAFYWCGSLTSITIPSSITSIGSSAFYNCSSLTSITIPSSVTSIGSSAFSRCSSLTSITIPSGVTSIGDSVFRDCSSLTAITIPGSVTSIGGSAFYNCSSLTKISVTSKNSYYCSDTQGVLFNKNKTQLIQAPAKLTGGYTIPNSVTSIGNYAFRGCDSLTSITIPDSVASIGDDAFRYCSSLASITIPGSVEFVGKGAFSSTAWYEAQPQGLLYVGKVAYKYKGNASGAISIREGTTQICESAFSGCSNLTEISIPNSVTSIGDSAFFSCSSLASITIPSGVTEIGFRVFQECSGLTSVRMPNSLTSIGDQSFCECGSLTTIVIPYGVKTIGRYAFNDCKSLNSIVVPGSVTSVGEYAFDGCGMLNTVLYRGTVNQSEAISVERSNEIFSNATWHYEITEQIQNGQTVYVCGECGQNYCPDNHLIFQELRVVSKPEKTIYYVGEWSVDLTGLRLEGIYADGTSLILEEGAVQSVSADLSTSGIKNVTVTTSGGTAEFEIYVHDPLYITIDSALYPESEHNYANNIYDEQSISYPGAKYLVLTFSKETYVEKDHDYISIYNNYDGCCLGSATGSEWAGKSVIFYAASIRIELSTDSTGTGYGYSFESIKAYVGELDHPSVQVPGTSTCTQPGLSAGTCCGICGMTLTGREPAAALGHSWSDWQVIRGNTCTEPGLQSRTCKVCGEEETKEIPAAHVYGAYVVTLAPTCLDAGTKTRTCTICGNVDTQTVAPLRGLSEEMIDPKLYPYPESSHDYPNNANETKTFTYPGAEKLTITFSVSSMTESNYDKVYIYDANGSQLAVYTGSLSGKTLTITGDTFKINLTSDGSVQKWGYSFSSIVAHKTPTHTWGEWEETTAPTCTEKGTETRTCSYCGLQESREGTALVGHNGQWMELVPATCTTDGINARICTTCGETETETVVATGHSYSAVVTAPTCTEKGYTTKTCATCGEISVTDYVDALGHSYSSVVVEPTCTEQGYTTKTCATCGDVTTEYVPAKGHGWSAWITTVKPTCTTEGAQLRFCNCGTRETEVIAKLPHSLENYICTVCGELDYANTVLTGDVQVNWNLTQDLYIDLAGFDLSGTIITNGYKVYGMDSTTDRYTCDGIGYFTCVDENGNYIVPERICAEGEKQYMAICTEDRYSFHRFFVGITHMTLAPETVGLGYKTAVYGDEMVFSQLDAFTFQVQLEGYNPVYRYFDRDELTAADPIALKIRNFDVENYSEHNLYAQVSLTLNDGTVIETEQVSLTFRWLAEQVNANYTDYTDDQLASFKAMLQVFDIVKKWNIPNLI